MNPADGIIRCLPCRSYVGSAGGNNQDTATICVVTRILKTGSGMENDPSAGGHRSHSPPVPVIWRSVTRLAGYPSEAITTQMLAPADHFASKYSKAPTYCSEARLRHIEIRPQ